MTAEPTAEGGALVLVPDTELDLLTCPGWHCELIGALKREDCNVLIVDFSQVEFFGATGLEVLVDVRDRAARCGVNLRLIVCSRPVWRPLEVTGLAADFSVYGNRADALTGHRRRRGSETSDGTPAFPVHRVSVKPSTPTTTRATDGPGRHGVARKDRGDGASRG